MNADLDQLLEKMPDENATEEEISAFMDQVLATPGGEELIRDFARKITEGGSLDTMLKEDEEERERLTLESPVRMVFRVELTGTKPLVWRRLSLPADCTYFHLHCAIQDAFGWQATHLHRFEVWAEGRRELTFSLSDEEEEDYCEIQNRVFDLYREEVIEFIYLYDFGDDWRHRVIIEEVVPAGEKGTSKELSTQLHGGAGHGPPENCGGVYGYHDFLKGDHPFCKNYRTEILDEFRTGQPDFEKITFQDPLALLKRYS